MNTTSSRQQVPSWDEADQLISILRAWGINYLIGEDYPVDPTETSGDQQTAVRLIQRLAQCEYPRVRDASISLFLLHPELAPAVLEVIQVSEPVVAEQITTLVLATLYVQRLWSPRLTIALGHESGFPEEPFVDLWRSRLLPPPSSFNTRWGLRALQAFEQRRTGLSLNFLHDWQNQVDHLLLQEEVYYHHPIVPIGQVLKEDQPRFVEENVDMSMRPKVDKAAIDGFLKALGRAFRKPGRLYLVGGAALVHRGVRAGTTLDIHVEVSGENEGEMIETIRRLIQQLNINVEFASPRDFLPLPHHWMTQSQYVGRYGAVDVFYFDFYSIALSKIQRGSSLDINDVRLLLQQGIITLEGLDGVYKEVLVQVGKGSYAKLDPQRFAEHYTAVRQLL
jgi:Nucleotidyltransferase of unknown function (DUF6036)